MSVVITGVGVISAIGNDTLTFWRNLVHGVSGAGPITAFPVDDFPVHMACEVKEFDPLRYMDRKTARRSHRSTQFAIAAAAQALGDAGLSITEANADRVGVVINTGAGGLGEMEDMARLMMDKGPRAIGPFVIPRIMPNALYSQVSLAFGAQGPSISSALACASGNYALVEAAHYIQRGEADVILAGGSEAVLTPIVIAAFHRMGVLSKRETEPHRACRPFDAERDGFVAGEGAAVIVLEREEHARARDAHIYARVFGGALTSDAHHITAPEPSGRGAAQAIKRALHFSGVAPEDVDVIFAHGTATRLNDVIETKAIRQVFADHAYDLAISATKSMVGHTMGAAGALSSAAAALSIRDRVIPPTINHYTPDPECDLDYVPNAARPADVRVAMVNAFGFGGHNAVLLLGSS
jgi:3-oxoacyl-[acyl-carrier-protein] synthase II